MSSDELLQQLQPLLLVEELSKHRIQSELKQRNILSQEEGLNKTTVIDNFMKEEHDYYSKKSKELKLLCSNFIARQNRLILQGISLKQQLKEHDEKMKKSNSENGVNKFSVLKSSDSDFPTEFIFEQQSQHIIQVCALLIQEITQTITIIKTLWESIIQLVKCFEFVITHSLQSKLSDLDNLSKHLSILLKELERFSIVFSLPNHDDFSLDLDGNSSAVLVFARQPFPGMVKRHKQMQPDELIVEMLTTSNFPYTYSKLKVHSSANISTVTGLNSTIITTTKNNNNNNNSNSNSNNSSSALSPSSSSNSNDSSNNINNNNNNSNEKSDLFETHTFDLFPSENNKYSGKTPLKFVKGTTQFSSLKFSISLIHKVTKEQFIIETNYSERFIVFANDSQWVDHFCQLLKDEIFLYQDTVSLLNKNNNNNNSNNNNNNNNNENNNNSNNKINSDKNENDDLSKLSLNEPAYLFNQVTHHRVIKTLQKFFPICLNIRKSLVQQYQPLPNEPLQNLLNQISENKITNDEFDSFISILSPAFKVIKYQKNAIDLWNMGMIFLFIDNEKAKQLLLSPSTNTTTTNNNNNNNNNNIPTRFLVQFSSNHPFCWVIKYLDDENEIKEIFIDMKTDLVGDRNSKSILSFIENNLTKNLKEICLFDQKLNQVRFLPKNEIRSLIS